jgi:hypothetical protein
MLLASLLGVVVLSSYATGVDRGLHNRKNLGVRELERMVTWCTQMRATAHLSNRNI